MSAEQVPLYVRLAAEPSQMLDRAVAVSGRTKRQIVEDAVREHLEDQRPVVGRISLREPLPEVMTLEEAAAMLRVPGGELEASAIAGAVPGRRIGHEWRFGRTALLAWLGDPAQPGKPAPPDPARASETDR